MNDFILKRFQESADLKIKFAKKNKEKIIEVVNIIVNAFKSGNKLIIFGNGGSAADAQHIAAEFVNRFQLERIPLPAIALTTNSSIITSISNDYDFSDIFSKQIKALGKENDIALGISTSGASPNVNNGMKTAKEMKLTTVSFTGKDGGEIIRLSDYYFLVESNDTPRIQEVHITLGHIICELVENILFKPQS